MGQGAHTVSMHVKKCEQPIPISEREENPNFCFLYAISWAITTGMLWNDGNIMIIKKKQTYNNDFFSPDFFKTKF